jgi:hypothetical protein
MILLKIFHKINLFFKFFYVNEINKKAGTYFAKNGISFPLTFGQRSSTF